MMPAHTMILCRYRSFSGYFLDDKQYHSRQISWRQSDDRLNLPPHLRIIRMPSPVQSNCDAHDTIAKRADDISVFCRRRTSNTTSPCRLLHIPVVLNDFHSRETTL
ncbi:hypothetical protein TNCV_801371 [Trichonephila clavipes]|nr:hypothetical protein TNCV_801371 [Trichonephila clavipes]